MRRIRVIPTLLMSRERGGLVKGKQFRKHVYVGDPINAVKVYNDKGVDEIAILDIDATRDGRTPDFEWVQEICGEAFMPLAYGGAVSRIEHVKELLQRGAEKVIINSANVTSFNLVSEAARVAGSQSVVVSIDAKKTLFGGYRVFTHAATRDAGVDPVEFARKAEIAGAGEIMLTSVEREGTMSGYELGLVQRVASAVRIPVVASGGAGCIEDFEAAVQAGASAVAAGSMFVFIGKHRAVLISYPEQRDLERLFNSVS